HAADQLLDRVAVIADHPGLHLDDRGRPPVLGSLRRLARRVAHAAPSRANSSASFPENPSSASNAALSAPSAGGGECGCGSPLARRKPERTTRTGRSTPGTWSKVLISSRSVTCGCSSTDGTSSTSPAGTPCLLGRADPSRAQRPAPGLSVSA